MHSSWGAQARRILFKTTGRIRLLDPIRDFAYQWSWRFLRVRGMGAVVYDIGSRSSPFPAFLSRLGFSTTVVEKDARFFSVQEHLASAWKTQLNIRISDLNALGNVPKADAICVIFALQHAGDSDTECYRTACALLKPGGILLAVNQCSSGDTVWERGRDDGDMRIYGHKDLLDRIVEPVTALGCVLTSNGAAVADFKQRQIRKTEASDPKRNVSLLSFRKSEAI